MGSLDANGVWQYDDNDHMIPHAAYENLGQASISAAIADVRADLTIENIAWTTLTRVNTGSLTGDVEYSKWGRVVTVRGALTCTGNLPSLDGTTGISVATLPVGTRPGGDARFVCVGAAENNFFLNITSVGVLSVYAYGPGSTANGNVIRIYATFLV